MKKRLNYLYDNAIEIPFDNNSKLVFISDVHRGDGTYFDPLMANRNIYISALKYYYKNNFTYVEVGDGDELWKNRNCNEIAYFYEEVFHIFNKFRKKDKIHMIYGNHDIIKKKKNFNILEENSLKKVEDDYSKEFLNFIKNTKFYEAINFRYTPVDEKMLVTHGNQVEITNYNLVFINRFLVRYVWKFLFGIAGFKNPNGSAKSKAKKTKADLKLQKWARDNNKIILCGHTHNARFPNEFEPPYFNDGCCILPYAMTSIEIENGEIALVKWSVDVRENGVLWVKRNIVGGPKKISIYLERTRDKRYEDKKIKKEGKHNESNRFTL